MNAQPVLRLDNVGCSKGGRPLFRGLQCTLRTGHWLHVAGANGAGKTSLLRMLCGLSPIDSGDIFWNGQSIRAQRTEYQQDLCYLGHLNGLQESLTALENLSFATALRGHAAPLAQLAETLARFGVAGRGQQLVRHLSQGQKRRVALARLALAPARLWVLDEPFVAMDDAGMRMLEALIAGHLDHGGLAVLTSHQTVNIGSAPMQTVELRS